MMPKQSDAKNIVPDWLNYAQIPVGTRGAYPLHEYYILKQYSDTKSKWKHVIGAFSDTHNDVAEFNYFAKEFDAKLKHYLDTYLKEKKRIHHMEHFIERAHTLVIKKLTKTKLESLSNKQLVNLLDYFFNGFFQIIFASGQLRFIDLAAMQYLSNILRKNPDAITTLTICEKEAFNTKEEKALLKLAISLCNKKQSVDSLAAQKGLKNIYENYCWITCGYYNEQSRAIKEYHELLQERLRKDPIKLLRDIEQKQKEEIKKRDDLFKSLRPNAKQAFVIRLAQLSTFLKDLVKARINEITFRAEPFFYEAAKRIGITMNELKHYFPHEINAALIQKNVLPSSRIVERKRHRVIVAEPGIFEIYEGKDADVFHEKYFKMSLETSNEFTGRVASKGHAKGVVRVVLGAFDFTKVHEGDILVVSNTTPDYVRIMKKAAAIVAEEGGLTAHVSVVSREFGIPCVVGIPNITKQLKDGDIVEVDAEKGVVRKIEK